ncbi:flippase-like domain-containing protein [Candidatus Saccharibacteria bacterium]|nr:flippase-like domain-containing protein [Candidatus Saccharibacteria bacterium]
METGMRHSFWQRNWKAVLNVVTVLALCLLIYAIRDQFSQTFENLLRVNMWALLLMIPLQVLNYDAQTRLYKHLFVLVGNKLSYKELFKSSVALNYVNHLFPSGGVTGISYFAARLKSEDITGAKASAVQLFKLVLYFLSFEILIVIGVFALAIQGHMNSLILLVAGSIATALVITTFGLGFVVSSRRRIAGFFMYVTKWLNRMIRIIRPNHPQQVHTEKIRVVFDDLHDNYKLMSQDWSKLKWPFLWALFANIWEVLTIYVVYVAFGDLVNIGAVILAYAVANFAGLVSVLPGGVGVYEGLMTLTLSATGVPSRLSLPVTIMYRILSTLIQMPPGAYFYHKHLNRVNVGAQTTKKLGAKT